MDHDYDLYHRFRGDGDERAFEELVGIYAARLTGYINGLVGDETAALELATDTFAELAASRMPFRGASSFETYLFSIAKHLAFRYLKKRKKQAALLENLPLEDFSEKLIQHSPEYGYLREEDRASVRAALTHLKPGQRDVLRLLYFKGMTYAEAAKETGMTEGQIRGLAHRAKGSLKKILENEGFGEHNNNG